MTRIDCETASANKLRPEEYIGCFVERDGDCILLATDEEFNDSIRLDLQSAEFLGGRLLQLAEEIRKGR